MESRVHRFKVGLGEELNQCSSQADIAFSKHFIMNAHIYRKTLFKIPQVWHTPLASRIISVRCQSCQPHFSKRWLRPMSIGAVLMGYVVTCGDYYCNIL